MRDGRKPQSHNRAKRGRVKTVDAGGGIERRSLSPVLPGIEFELLRFTLAPGVNAGTFPPHRAGSREYLAVEAGMLSLVLDGVEYRMRAGDSIYHDGDCEHGYRNDGDAPCIYYLAMDVAGVPIPRTASFRPVCSFRNHHGIAVYRESEWADRGEITLEAAAQIMDVSVMTALRMIQHGIIKGRQLCRGAPWVIKAEDLAAYREQKASRHPLTSNPAQQSFQFQ